MAALGLIFGLLLIVKLGREQGLDPDKLWNLGIIAILSGIAGAKVLMILVDLGYYRAHPGEIFTSLDACRRVACGPAASAGARDVHLVHAREPHAGVADLRRLCSRAGAGTRLRPSRLLRRWLLLGSRTHVPGP